MLAVAFRFVCAYDPHLLRLEEHWRVIPNGIAIHDSYNNQDLPLGREATMEEWESEGDKCFFEFSNVDRRLRLALLLP